MVVCQQAHIPVFGSHAELGQFAVIAGDIPSIVGRLLNDGQGKCVGNIYAAYCVCVPVLNRFGKLCEIRKGIVPHRQSRYWIEEKGNKNCKKKAAVQYVSGDLIFECHFFLFDKDTQNKPANISLTLSGTRW